MNYPLSKNKLGNPTEYIYRGERVLVTRAHGDGGQCIASTYWAPERKVIASSAKRFKKMMDRRIDSTTEETL